MNLVRYVSVLTMEIDYLRRHKSNGSRAPRPPGATGQSEDQLGRPPAHLLPRDCLMVLEATQTDKDLTQTTRPSTDRNFTVTTTIGSF